MAGFKGAAMLPSGPMDDIGAAVARVHDRMRAAALRAGRDDDVIELVAVSKTIPAERLQTAVDAGIDALGENRVQEAEGKIPRVRGPVRWHLIGRLQSNKARRAASLFDVIHSVDRQSLTTRLDRAAGELGRTLDVYVQVEFVRDGLPSEAIESRARAACAAVAAAGSLRLRGLMTLPPFDPDPEQARPWFRKLVALRERISADEGIAVPGLSMGMSGDFEVAIEEGSTAVRVGTAIFGARA